MLELFAIAILEDVVVLFVHTLLVNWASYRICRSQVKVRLWMGRDGDAVVFTASPHSLFKDARTRAFEKDLGWAPRLDGHAAMVRKLLFRRQLHRFEQTQAYAAKVRNVSRLGSQFEFLDLTLSD
jgi:hypothetical protein